MTCECVPIQNLFLCSVHAPMVVTHQTSCDCLVEDFQVSVTIDKRNNRIGNAILTQKLSYSDAAA